MRTIRKWGTVIAMALSVSLITPATVPATSFQAEAASIKINYTKKTLKAGKTLKLKVTGAGKKKVTWSSSKKAIAAVSKTGKVTAKKKGTATITAKIGKTKKTCKITVEKVNPYVAKAPYQAVEIKLQNTPFSVAAPKSWFSEQAQLQEGYQMLQLVPKKGDGKSAAISAISLSIVEQPASNGIPDYETIAKPYFETALTADIIKDQLINKGLSDVSITNYKQEDLRTSLGTVFKVTLDAAYNASGTGYEEKMSLYYIFINGYLLQLGIDDFTSNTTTKIMPSLTEAAEYLINSLYRIK